VLLYDRFDVWQVDADGSNATRLTRGKEDSTVYRYVNVDDEAGPGVGGGRGGAEAVVAAHRRSTPISRSCCRHRRIQQEERLRALTIGQPAQRLLFVDKSVGRLDKADDADVYAYTAADV
jgi:hypothetical protein